MRTSPTGFFVTGGTMPRDAPSYVERKADSDLLAGLRRGEFCYVLTSRQLGKSSLMVRTATRLRLEGAAVAVLDLTGLGQNISVEQWYRGLLNRMGRQLEIEEEVDRFWRENDHLSPLLKWIAAIQQIVLYWMPGKVVVFIDEIDFVRSLKFSTDEFFAAIRAFYNRRAEEPEFDRLTFCLLGVASPADLILDPQLTPFNIGTRIQLNDFTPQEAAGLARGLGDVRQSAALLARVLYWTNGHPYLTQKLCRALVESGSESTVATVDRLCENMFLTRRAWEQDENLVFVREQILRASKDTAGMLDLYSAVHRGKRVMDDDTNPLVSLLRLSGVTGIQNGRLFVRNRIYERVFNGPWIRKHMPDAELRRQRSAYRRGLVRASLVSSGVLITILALLWQTVNSNIKARSATRAANNLLAQIKVQRDSAEHDLYVSNINLAYKAFEENDVDRTITLLESCRSSGSQDNTARFEWQHLWGLCHGYSVELKAEQGQLRVVAYSPNGTLLATAGSDGSVVLRDIKSGRPVRRIVAHKGVVWALGFSGDGRVLASSGADRDPDGAIRLWDVSNGTLLKEHLFRGTAVHSVAFCSKDGSLALGCADGSIVKTDSTLQNLRTWSRAHKEYVWCVTFSPDGQTLASAGEDGIVKLWDWGDGKVRKELVGHTGRVRAAAFFLDGHKIVTGGFDRTLRIWDTGSGKLVRSLPGHEGAVSCVAFSSNGRTLASGSNDQTIRVWNLNTGHTAYVLHGHKKSVSSLAISSDSKTLATVSTDERIRLWNLADPSHTWSAGHEVGDLHAISLSDDIRIMAIAAERETSLWATQSGRKLNSLRIPVGNGVFPLQKSQGVISRIVALSSDSTVLATGHDNGDIHLWMVSTGAHLRLLKGHQGAVLSLEFSPDGHTLASGGLDRTVTLWETDTGAKVSVFKENEGAVHYLSFAPDGKILIACTLNNTVRVLKVNPLSPTDTLPGFSSNIRCMRFSSDGRCLAISCVDGTIRLFTKPGTDSYDKYEKNEASIIHHAGSVSALAFTSSGLTLAAAGVRGRVKLWDIRSKRELCTLAGGLQEIDALAFGLNDTALVAVDHRGMVRSWPGVVNPVLITPMVSTGSFTYKSHESKRAVRGNYPHYR
jgi:WD40 repeat protein